MRPAQKAPENTNFAFVGVPTGESFNEAGAKSAGKPLTVALAGTALEAASMRPAQKAPENAHRLGLPSPRLRGFNEAGAKSAGKLQCKSSKHSSVGMLQ